MRRRGSALVLALLVGIVLLLLGLGLLVMQSRAYDEARLLREHAQAGLLARAGVKSAMLRLMRDRRFPPRLGGRTVYGYTETLPDPDNPDIPVGTCSVTIDVSRRGSASRAAPNAAATYLYPWYTLRVRSVGAIADANGRIRASRALQAEIDVSPAQRGQLPVYHPENDSVEVTNPQYFRCLRWEDDASL
ncbi:MAG: hypothetical protein EB084_18055 [Proteobacteria bacterium]|nr:hypothetical protein [Pseudomonadota bacterium]